MKRLWMAVLWLLCAGPVVAVELGDDGLHKTPWMRETFKEIGRAHV